jgi:hypothetical protein
MLKADIKAGEEYAIREKGSPNATLQCVRILQHARGTKWKAEWIEPNQGLVDYVESKNVVVRWKERKAFLRDEEAERQLDADNERHGYKEDSPVVNAVTSVFEAVGEKGLTFYRGELAGPPDALNRVRKRAEVEQSKQSPYTYVDRHGTVHVPFSEALSLAQAFSAAEPAAVLVDAESTERKWSVEASQPGGDYLVGLLNEYRAAWALIRQWTGHDPAVAHRETQIQRLERLVLDAIYALQKAGLDSEANRLRRALGRD